jgi:hypothetical protein
MDTEERLARVMSALTEKPLSTRELKARAGVKGHSDRVLHLLVAAVQRGEARCHGKDTRGEYLWSLP